MKTLLTSGVKIKVTTSYRKDLSEITASQYFFNYRIEISNTNSHSIQLLNRDWYIFDSLNQTRYISGSGVIGEQPVLKPGEKYSYMSGCDLTSEIGMMKGFYTFKNLETDELFEAFIPTFRLESPAKLN